MAIRILLRFVRAGGIEECVSLGAEGVFCWGRFSVLVRNWPEMCPAARCEDRKAVVRAMASGLVDSGPSNATALIVALLFN